MNRFVGVVLVILLFSPVIYAQAEKENDQSAQSPYVVKQPEEEVIPDLTQLFNRTDWRITNLNNLVNRWESEREFKVIAYEAEKLSELLDIAEKKFAPEEKKDAFLAITSSMKEICAAISAKAREKKEEKSLEKIEYKKKHEELKLKANELFKKYMEFKLSLKKPTIQELQ